ncbi:Acetyl-CoA synthetase-like protein [Mycena venus]|uniref:Acetyl-CoA synthetase-like protein n=1 Tax=Mycena venus TaxID=2733690 RepID=A0A8H7CJH2_9AGAR|nr:Acetyl-CoA synthetase-like protein [Mycena venus]
MASKNHFMYPFLDALSQYAALPLFKKLVGEGASRTCVSITYQAFEEDLNKTSLFWAQKLSDIGVKSSDVVGLWITGAQYTDLVHLYSGFVPQIFSQKFTAQGLAVIGDLLSACDGKALVYDPSFGSAIQELGLPSVATPDLETLAAIIGEMLPTLPEVEPTDTAMIFHTSGTTSGKPKPVPESHRWFKFQTQQWQGVCQGSFNGQDLFNNIGSFGHVGSATYPNHICAAGQCMVQLPPSGFDRETLLDLTRLAGLNNLFLYAPWFSKLINMARTDPEVLGVLRGMHQIVYTGASLNPEDEAWIVEQGLPSTVLYATTEIALCLVSDLNDLKTLPAMRVVPGVQCEFIPTKSLKTSELAGDVQDRTCGGQLYDFFIPASAPNCPHPSIRNRPDGHISGDLFEEVQKGYYAFRGRNDDWIRTGPGLSFCDTKSIEDNCMLNCADLVKNCTVVGHYKPAVVLFIEPALSLPGETDVSAFKAGILRQTTSFNDRLFQHERITDPNFIVVVPPGSLPRTTEKGNIRRKAVEDEYADLLQQIYNNMKS